MGHFIDREKKKRADLGLKKRKGRTPCYSKGGSTRGSIKALNVEFCTGGPREILVARNVKKERSGIMLREGEQTLVKKEPIEPSKKPRRKEGEGRVRGKELLFSSKRKKKEKGRAYKGET